jgi:hypothetical protein
LAVRVYHFVNDKYGLEDIRLRRLKVAMLEELNDPFELLGIDLRHPQLRHAVQKARSQFGKLSGFLCFSRRWYNPVQWSHYAEKHAGLCLGFEIPDKNLAAIIYSGRRLAVDIEKMRDHSASATVIFERILFTKYAHWRYEAEVRAIVPAQTPDPSNNLYFAEFSDDLALRQVIVGARSGITRAVLNEALGNLQPSVEIFKARLAFGTFRVVRQRDPNQWS